MPPAWYLAVCALEGAQRLRELALSRSRSRSLSGPRAAARSYPLMVALHVALFAAPPVEIALLHRRPRLPLLWLGLLAGAAGLRAWSIASLGGAWNVQALVPTGLRPVVTGPYRYVRHPNYTAVALEFAALPLAGGAWLSALVLSVLNAFVLADRVRAEERLLATVPGYSEAFRGRRRFLPGLL